MRFLSLFAGIGGLDLGLERAGMTCVGQVELNPYSISRLEHHWPSVSRFRDVREVSGDEVRRRCGTIDAICGGFPCQDISNAGHREGIDGDQSGLWSEFSRLIGELRPRVALVENVAALLVRGIDRVLGDLADLGYDAEWSVVSACAVGAPHTRERVFIVAYPQVGGWAGASNQTGGWRAAADEGDGPIPALTFGGCSGDGWREWWASEPEVARVVDGVPADVDGPNRAIGNAVVPQVAEYVGRAILASTWTPSPLATHKS